MFNNFFLANVVVFSLIIPSFTSAEEWILERNGSVYSLDIVMRGDNISGRYLRIDNNSTYQGVRYINRGKNLISLTQVGGTYVAIHAGILKGNRYVGTFYDNAGNEGKKFTLRKK